MDEKKEERVSRFQNDIGMTFNDLFTRTNGQFDNYNKLLLEDGRTKEWGIFGIDHFLKNINHKMKVPEGYAKLPSLPDQLKHNQHYIFPRLSGRYFRIDVPITIDGLRSLETDYPNFRFFYRSKFKKSTSAHPTLRTYREMARYLIYNDLKSHKHILNVGDSGWQDLYYGVNTHVLGPVVDDRDVMRHGKFRHHGNVTKCHHKIEECFNAMCMCNPNYNYSQEQYLNSPEWAMGNNVAPTARCQVQNIRLTDGNNNYLAEHTNSTERAIVLVHSLYYIKLDDLIKMMVSGHYGEALAVVHKFVGNAGHFFEEGYWRKENVNGIEHIRMAVCEGSKTPVNNSDTRPAYFHKSMQFLFDGIEYKTDDPGVTYKAYRYKTTIGNIDYTLVWNIVRETSVDATFSFKIVPNDLQPAHFMDCKTIKSLLKSRDVNEQIKKIKDKYVSKYMLTDIDGIRAQPIIREMFRDINNKNITPHPETLSKLINEIHTAVMGYKTQFAKLMAHVEIDNTLSNKAMKDKVPLEENMLLSNKEVERSVTRAETLIFKRILGTKDIFYYQPTNLTLFTIMVTILVIVGQSYFKWFENEKYFHYGVMVKVLLSAMLVFKDYYYRHPANLVENNISLKCLSNEIRQRVVAGLKPMVRQMQETMLLPILLVFTCFYPSLGMLFFAFIYMPRALWLQSQIKMGIAAGYLVTASAQKTTRIRFDLSNAVPVGMMVLLMLMLLFAVVYPTDIQLTGDLSNLKFQFYEPGELIYYGECAKEIANYWKQQDPDSWISYNQSLWDTDCEKKPIVFTYGPHLIDYKCRISTNCVHNEVHCLINRQLFDLNIYSDVLMDEFTNFRSWCFENVDEVFGDFDVRILGMEEWFEKFRDNKKKERAIKAHRTRGYRPMKPGYNKELVFRGDNNPVCGKADGRIAGFIKKELITGKTLIDREEPDKYAARLIQATDQYINNVMGPYMYTFSSELKKVWNWRKGSIVTYASGLNRQQLGEWYDCNYAKVAQYGEVVCYESDYSKFDKHHSARHLMLEHDLMDCVLKMPDETRRACNSTLTTYGYMPRGTKYACKATRKSGFQDTTVGNTLLSVYSNLYKLCKILKCKFNELERYPVHILSLGDDIYTLTTREIARKLMDDTTLKHIGWSVKKKTGVPVDGTFCSSVFMPSSNGTILTGLPGRIYGKVFSSSKQLVKVNQQKYYANVVAKGLLADNKHNPLVSIMLERIIALTEGTEVKKTGFMSTYWKEKNNRSTFGFGEITSEYGIDPAIWEFYAARYGVSMDEILDFINYVANIPTFKVGLRHHVLNRIIAVDLEDTEPFHHEMNRGELWDVVGFQPETSEDSTVWYSSINSIW